MLTSKELNRYNRHVILSDIGLEGQEKLKSAKVLVIGAGGLGCPMLQYLSAAGVGTIGIVDYDIVDESNLQRQVLFNQNDVGKNKVVAASEKLVAMNPYINIIEHNEKLTPFNALSIINEYEIVADGTDNFSTRYLVNDACIISGKPLVFGSIFKFEGQVAILNYPPNDSSVKGGASYRCLFPIPPPSGQVPNCSEVGVLGVLPGIIGTIQANEVLKLILGIGKLLAGELLVIDAKTMEFNKVLFKKTDSEISKILKIGKDLSKIDYENFCNNKNDVMIQEITPVELMKKIDQKEPYQLIDVREPFEYKLSNIKGELIPMNKIFDNVDKITKDRPVIIHCRTGQRSALVVQQLQKAFGFTNLYNLKGGIKAWFKELKKR